MSTTKNSDASLQPEARNQDLWAQYLHARATVTAGSDQCNKYRRPPCTQATAIEMLQSIPNAGQDRADKSKAGQAGVLLPNPLPVTPVTMVKETGIAPDTEKGAVLREEANRPKFKELLRAVDSVSGTSVTCKPQPAVPEAKKESDKDIAPPKSSKRTWSGQPRERKSHHPCLSRNIRKRAPAPMIRSSDISRNFEGDMGTTASRHHEPKGHQYGEDRRQVQRSVCNGETLGLPQVYNIQPSDKADGIIQQEQANHTYLEPEYCSPALQESSKACNGPSNEARARGESIEQVKRVVRRQEATAARKEQMREIQAERMAEIRLNMNRHCNEEGMQDTACELLQTLRVGEGTDPNSEFSKSIAQRLIVSNLQDNTNTIGEVATPLRVPDFNRDGNRICRDQDKLRNIKLWRAYADDTEAYPKIDENSIRVFAEPSPEHLITRRQMAVFAEAIRENAGRNSMGKYPSGRFFLENQYPKTTRTWQQQQLKPGYEGFDAWFEKWINDTMHNICIVDIYHKSFFDGDSHPDGQTTMFLPRKDCLPTRLDMNDTENCLHRHETADGYRFNYLHMVKSARITQRLQQAHARNAYLEASRTRNPQAISPTANIYLRPAEASDVQGLLNIHDWYVANATQCIEVSRLDASEMRQKIQECRQQKLPFIVAVQRRIGTRPAHDRSQPTEHVLGYCFASSFMGIYTAEVRVFVHHKHKRQGIGSCLMDKLLEACDPQFTARQGYFFDSDPNDRQMYSSGGARQLTRLILLFYYNQNDSGEYKCVKRWLEENFNFQQQGLLNGVSVKFNRSLDVAQLVRNIPSFGVMAGM